ncbi:hypothetical protein KAU19_04405 [Candidatus Parcubacteria bacterium]|nr:hypothetical protein [Candidatus Parcubacteria bacterium]
MRAIFVVLDSNHNVQIMEFASLKKGRIQGWCLKQDTFFNNAKPGDTLTIPTMIGNGYLHIKFDKPAKIFLHHCFYQATLKVA